MGITCWKASSGNAGRAADCRELLLDATNGAAVAQIRRTAHAIFGAALEHARSVGGAALAVTQLS